MKIQKVSMFVALVVSASASAVPINLDCIQENQNEKTREKVFIDLDRDEFRVKKPASKNWTVYSGIDANSTKVSARVNKHLTVTLDLQTLKLLYQMKGGGDGPLLSDLAWSLQCVID